jgi:hypothetical protein
MAAPQPTPLKGSVVITAGASWTRPHLDELSDYDQWWGINETWYGYWKKDGSKPDLIVAMDDLRRDLKTEPDYVDRITQLGIPIIGPEKIARWPQIEAYPLKEAIEFIGLPQAWRVFDNSINYAMILAMMKGFQRIAVRGTDFVKPYEAVDLECAMVRWKHRKYANPPDWFKYYEELSVFRRAPTEPGNEATHFLIGWGIAKGYLFDLADTTTILNSDREKFYYGFQNQPKGV